MNKVSTVFVFLLLAGLFFTGCGPSAKRLEEKRLADSAVAAASATQAPSNELSLTTRTPADKKFIKTAETRFLVSNVRKATDEIEDLAAKYDGYLTYSNLRNRESDFAETSISKDSVAVSKKIIVENNMVLKIPNENLDSLVRKLNKLILFLDYRIVKMDDISFSLLANQKAAERLGEYEKRQKKHIDTKESKLKETTHAEETVLNRQHEADYLQIQNQELEEQVKYCTLTIYIYQKPFYYYEIQVLPNTDSLRPNIFVRIFHAVLDGWVICEYFIVFMFNIWWLFVLGIGTYLLIRLGMKLSNKNKQPPARN